MLSKFTTFINILIKYLSLFCLSFIWLNFYLRDYKISLLLAIAISIISGILLKLIFKKLHSQTNIKIKEQKKIKEISNQLLFLDEKKVYNFFNTVLTKKFDNIVLQKKYFIINNEKNKTAFLPFYKNFSLHENDILSIYNEINKNKINKLYIFCVNYNSEALRLSKLVKECEIILLNEYDAFKKILQPLNIYPETKPIFKENKKLQAKEYLYLAFNKSQTKKYFFGAVIMVFFSFFTPFRIYYLIFSSLFFVFAIFSRFNQPFNPPKIDLFD